MLIFAFLTYEFNEQFAYAFLCFWMRELKYVARMEVFLQFQNFDKFVKFNVTPEAINMKKNLFFGEFGCKFHKDKLLCTAYAEKTE